MNKFFLLFLVLVLSKTSTAQSIFTTDTFSYTIDLDLSKNRYLKTVPVDLLKGYCKGDWNAYYPKREMNQCLFDDFLHRFNYFQLNIPTNTAFCFQDYCNDAYYKEMYQQFTRKLKYKEIVYLDQQHSFMKREVLWVQVYYSREEYDGWKHYEGPVFWLQRIKKIG
jgi:transposase-like protein